MAAVICMARLVHPREEHLTGAVVAPPPTHDRQACGLPIEGRGTAWWAFYVKRLSLGWC